MSAVGSCHSNAGSSPRHAYAQPQLALQPYAGALDGMQTQQKSPFHCQKDRSSQDFANLHRANGALPQRIIQPARHVRCRHAAQQTSARAGARLARHAARKARSITPRANAAG